MCAWTETFFQGLLQAAGPGMGLYQRDIPVHADVELDRIATPDPPGSEIMWVRDIRERSYYSEDFLFNIFW